ncbi:MAG: Sel1 repeat, partial [Proteobacteria bacterium]|nr:Sel1 repeat [Pseudomonadota bacterium]
MNRLILALLCAGFIHTAQAAAPLPDWLRYYQMAAERGDPEAQMKMGWAYEKGDGVEKDEKLAVEWYRRAALQNEP